MFFLMFFDGFDILIDKEIQLQIIGKKQITIKKNKKQSWYKNHIIRNEIGNLDIYKNKKAKIINKKVILFLM